MSTDDFETSLRARLTDLADTQDAWDDPLPEARRRAAADATPEVVSLDAARLRRRWWPGLAVAAVVLAVLVGGGFGVRELVRGSSGGSVGAGAALEGGSDHGASSCAVPVPSPCAVAPSDQTEGGPGRSGGDNTAGSGSAGSCAGPATGSCTDTSGCATAGPATSTGPLAGVASIRPTGIVGPRATSGGSAGVPYQVSFAESSGTAQFRAARAVWVSGGQLCASTGTAAPGAAQNVPVEPGAGISGSATFSATDSRGEPLPAGPYQLVIVIPYSVGGSAMSQLVSAPVAVEVTP